MQKRRVSEPRARSRAGAKTPPKASREPPATPEEKARRKRLGLRVKQLRKQRKLSQEDLAERIDKSVDTISNIERGHSSTRISTAFAIAEALKVSFLDLFDWVEATKLTPQQKDQAALVEKFRALLEGRSKPTMEDVVLLTQAISKAAARGSG